MSALDLIILPSRALPLDLHVRPNAGGERRATPDQHTPASGCALRHVRSSAGFK
jgi:hypothetical protein